MPTPIHVGMIVPPAGNVVPPEAQQLYPDIRFSARGLGIRGVDATSFDEALERLPAAVEELLALNVDAISLMGTSISFYTGWDGHDRLLDRLAQLAGDVPVTTMADAIVRGLRAVGARRIVVGAAYDDDLMQRLTSFVGAAGFEVLAHDRLDLVDVREVLEVRNETLVQLGAELIEAQPDSDALLVSCGGLRTLEMTQILGMRYEIPIVSSAVAGCHDAVATAGGPVSPR